MKNVDYNSTPIFNIDEFTKIYEAYYERIFKYIYYKIGDKHMSEELCSQVFEKIILNYNKFSGSEGSLDGWIFTIAKNVITDNYRKSKNIFCFPLDFLNNNISLKKTPDESTLSKEDNVYLINALKKLNSKERSVISFKYGAGLKNTEIANIMGLSESNVGVILCRSLKKLKKILVKDGFNYE